MSFERDALLPDARRLELDAALALASSFLCCVVGLVLGLRNLRSGNELLLEIERRNCSLQVQARVQSARALAIAAIVVSFAGPLTAVIAGTIAAFLGR